MRMAATEKDLGGVTAYAATVAAGYTGTVDEFEELMASYATVALEAEGYAVGEQNGVPVTSGSPYYENNAKYYSEQSARSIPDPPDRDGAYLLRCTVSGQSKVMSWENKMWAEIQLDVRTLSAASLAAKYPIGTELVCQYEYEGVKYNFPWIVLDNNRECTWEDGTTHNGLWLGAKYGSAESIQFDDPEGIVVDLTEEPNALDGWYYWAKTGQTWYRLNSLSPGDPLPTNYDIVYRISIDSSDGYFIIMYGNDRYKFSAIRQWLNSDAEADEWWTPQHTGDVAPSTANTLRGFMSGLDKDFVSVIHPVAVSTKTYEPTGDGSTDVTYDRFFLPSIEEVYCVPDETVTGIEGSYFPYWKTAIGTDDPTNGATPARVATRITDPDGSTMNLWWLRTVYREDAPTTYTGIVYSIISMDFSYGRGKPNMMHTNQLSSTSVLPACVIS